LRRPIRPGELAVQTSVIEDPSRLTDDAVDPRIRVGAGHRVQHHRPDSSQGKFARKHQSVRTSPGDDDINHNSTMQRCEQRSRPSKTLVALPCGQPSGQEW
jgi:hypothetical protein